MSLDVGKAVAEGFSDTFSKLGLSFVTLFFIVSSLYQSGIEGLSFSEASAPITTIAVTYSTAINLLFLVTGIIGYLLSFYLIVNHFYKDRNSVNLNELSGSFLPILNLVVASIIFVLIVLAGTIAFIIPGIYLYVSLIFYSVIIIVECENFIEALKKSWNITKGSKLKIFAILAILLSISFTIGIFTSLVSGTAELMQLSSSIGFFIGLVLQAVSSLMMVILVSTITSTYKGLRQV